MKTKHVIYFLLILLGAAIMGFGDIWVRKEYAMSLGIVVLMFGIYKTSRIWNKQEEQEEEQ